MEKTDPPPYAEQPMPGEQQAVPQVQANIQSPPAVLNYTPAQTYQPYPGGPTQPPMYPPMTQQPGQSTVIIHTTQRPLMPVGADPTFLRCPHCQNDVVTTIQVTPTGRTHMFALLLCLVGCWPCVCVPYCMDSCQSTNHYCPVCRAFVGRRLL